MSQTQDPQDLLIVSPSGFAYDAETSVYLGMLFPHESGNGWTAYLGYTGREHVFGTREDAVEFLRKDLS